MKHNKNWIIMIFMLVLSIGMANAYMYSNVTYINSCGDLYADNMTYVFNTSSPNIANFSSQCIRFARSGPFNVSTNFSNVEITCSDMAPLTGAFNQAELMTFQAFNTPSINWNNINIHDCNISQGRLFEIGGADNESIINNFIVNNIVGGNTDYLLVFYSPGNTLSYAQFNNFDISNIYVPPTTLANTGSVIYLAAYNSILNITNFTFRDSTIYSNRVDGLYQYPITPPAEINGNIITSNITNPSRIYTQVEACTGTGGWSSDVVPFIQSNTDYVLKTSQYYSGFRNITNPTSWSADCLVMNTSSTSLENVDIMCDSNDTIYVNFQSDANWRFFGAFPWYGANIQTVNNVSFHGCNFYFDYPQSPSVYNGYPRIMYMGIGNNFKSVNNLNIYDLNVVSRGNSGVILEEQAWGSNVPPTNINNISIHDINTTNILGIIETQGCMPITYDGLNIYNTRGTNMSAIVAFGDWCGGATLTNSYVNNSIFGINTNNWGSNAQPDTGIATNSINYSVYFGQSPLIPLSYNNVSIDATCFGYYLIDGCRQNGSLYYKYLNTANVSANFTNINGILNAVDIQSGSDWISVNSGSPANVPAHIQFNVTNNSVVPYKDGVICGVECSNIVNDGTHLNFDVTGWSNYSYGPGLAVNATMCQDINTSGVYVVNSPINFSTQDFQVNNVTITNNHATVSPTMALVSDTDPLTFNVPTTGSYYINFTMSNANSTSAILLSRHRVSPQMSATVYVWNYTSSAWDTPFADNTLGNSIYLSAYAITITNGFAYTLSPDYFSGGLIQVRYDIVAGTGPRWFDSQIYSETVTTGTRARTDCFYITANDVLLDFNSQPIYMDSPFNNGNYNLVTIADGLNNVSLTNLEYHSAATGRQINFLGPITNNSQYTNLHFYGDNIPFNASTSTTSLIYYNGPIRPSSNVLFENLTFTNINDTSTDGTGLYLLFANNIEYLTVRNIVVDNVNGGNEMLWFGDISGSIRNATGVLLENIVFQNMPIHNYLVEHILLGGTQDAIIRNININAGGVSGMLLNANYNITITNVTNELNIAPPQSAPYEGIRFGTAITVNSASTNNYGWWPCNSTLGATSPACYYNSTGQYNISGTYIDNRTPYYTYQAPPNGTLCDSSLSILPCNINGPYDYVTPNLVANFTTITGTINSGDILSGNNWIYVNSSSAANVPATITLTNTFSNPIIYKDGAVCTNCTILSTNPVSFNVTGFSNYTVLSHYNFTIPSQCLNINNTVQLRALIPTDNYTLANTTLNYPQCIENWVQDNYTCYAQYNYTITYHDTNMCGTNTTLPVNNGTVSLCAVLYPNVTTFDGSTSNFSNLTFFQIMNYSGLVLENTSNGKIEWNNNVNVYAADFDTYVKILPNFVSVNSGALNATINSPANISLYNVNIVSPWVFKDGVHCTSGNGCNILSNNGSTIKFTAPSFSNYTLGNCSEVWVQQPPMTCNGTNPSYTIIYADSNTCGTTYNLPANNGTVITCVLISYGGGTTTGYKGGGSGTTGYVNVSTNANYTIIKVYNETGGVIASNLVTTNSNNGTYSDAGLFDVNHPASYGYDGNYSTYAQPNATGYATIYTNYTIPYMATRLSQWNLVTYSNYGPGIDVNVTIPDNCWLYPTLQLSVEMYNDVGIHYVYPQCYNGTAWNILTIDQNSNHSGLYEESMYWILANGTDYTTTNLTEGVYYYNATGYPQTGQPVSTSTQNFTIIPNFHSERYNVTFPYPDNYKLNSHNLAVPFTSNDTYYNYTVYHVQGITNTSYNFNYTTTAKTYTFVLPDGKYYYAMTIYDKAGNNQYYDPNITIDTTPPVITYLSGTQADNSYIGNNKTNFTVNISVTDTYLNLTTIWLYKAGSVVDSYALYNTTLMNKTFTGLTNGVYKFNVTATDEANNTGIAATRTVTIIDTFQTGLYTVTYNYPNDYVSNVSTNNLINFTTTDPYYAYAIYNVSGTITNTTAQSFTPTLGEGIYNYNVRIYDLAGNSYQYPTQNITVDGTNPVITYIGATEADNSYIGNNRTNITVNIQVTDMHVNTSTNKIYLYDNAGNLLSQVNGTNLTTFTGLTAGVYKFNATSTDTFGHTGVSATRTVTLIPLFNAANYTVTFPTNLSASATFNATSFTTTDAYYAYAVYGIQLLPSGYSGSETTTRQFKNWTVPVDGIYHNYVTIYDLAGNSQYYDQNLTVNAGIPTLSYDVDTDAANSYKNQPYIFVHILPNATNATNMTTIIYLYNSSMAVIATANNTNTSNFTGLSDGVYYFNALASNNGYNTTALTRMVTIHQTFSSGLYNVTFPTANASLIGYSTFNATQINTTDPYYAYAVYRLSGTTFVISFGNGVPFSYVDNTTAKFKAWTSPDTEGYAQYNVTIYDLAGNSQTYGPRYIDVDTTPPYFVYYLGDANNSYVPLRNLPPGQMNGYVWEQVSISDAHPNAPGGNWLRIFGPNGMVGPIAVKTFNYTVVNFATAYWGAFDGPTNLSAGYYYYDAQASDALGHSTYLSPRKVTVIPAFNYGSYALTFPNGNNSYKNVNYFTAANFTILNPFAYYDHVTYSLVGLTNISYSNSVTTTNTTYTFTNIPDGKYYYSVSIYDFAGNIGYYDPNITIDTTPPTVNFTSASDGSYVYQRPYLYLQTNTTDVNINYTTIRVYNSTGGLVTSFTGNTSITTFTTGNLTDAFYYVNATTVDLAGNNGSTATYQIELDYLKNAVQFYASQKVTDTQLNYNITFNSSTNNFVQSNPGASKSTTVNAIPWNIYNVTITARVNGTYYPCTYYNWNATNNYIFPNCALYDSLDYINLTHSYLGTAISNYNVTIINTANAFLEIDTSVSNYSIGLVKGLNYTIYFDQPSYFSASRTYIPVNTAETINQALNQTNITLRFKSAFAGNVLNGTNITINDTTVPGKTYQTNTGYIYFNPNSGTKNFTMQAAGDIIPQPFALTFADRETSTRDVLLYPILNVSIFDEKASLLNETYFNFTHTTEAKYTLYCYFPANYTISGTIPNSTYGPINIPTPCIFNRIRFDLVFTNLDTTEFSYYRTITFPPDTTQFTFPVYLADHTTTDTVETALKPYDIFGIYTVDQNTQIQIKEIFPSGTKLITSDYMDSEGKITATLMTAGQYIITVLADDAPIRTLGPYYADSAGTKILRLFDVTLTGPTNQQTAVLAETSILENDSIRMHYADATATTQLLNLRMYNTSCDKIQPTMTPLVDETYTQSMLALSGNVVLVTYNLNGSRYMNRVSNTVYCTTYNRTDTQGRNQYTDVDAVYDSKKRLPAKFDNQWTLPWIIIIVLTILALGANARTAPIVSLGISLLAFLLYGWEWYTGAPGVLAHAALGLTIVLAFFYNFKRVS